MCHIPKHKNTVFITNSITVNKNISDSFHFIIHDLSKVYTELAKGHEYFRPERYNKLTVGGVINCLENAGNQSVRHQYIVDEIVENKRIHFYSKPSLVSVKLPWRKIESKSNTYVYYDFYKISNSQTKISMCIGIQFGSLSEKLFSQLTGGLIPWRNHCKEETEGLKKILSTN
ncbi:MAG: hypothetical protein JW973_13675 [Bacteroidales bacterium]|nr:hypothetical protein [Bacteroidales bacterium]